jgi:23S rRNA (uracil1939-C5)-methyltransferase
VTPAPGGEVPLTIDAPAHGGAGLGRLPDGRVCFVHGVIPGERALVRITRLLKDRAEGVVLRLLEASPRRVAPPCPLFGECGGCALQHMDYPLQLEIKTSLVRDALRRIAHLPDHPVEPMIASPLPYGYRNRISVHTSGRSIGFRRRASRDIVDVDHCLLASDEVNGRLAELRRNPPRRDARITLRERSGKRGFHQVNDAAAELLASTVAGMAGSGALLVDAYCGAGFFSKKLAPSFEATTGIEWSAPAVKAARRDAGPTESYHEGAVENLLPGILATAPPDATVLVADPPAEGLSPDVVRAILAHPPARLVYVSCDPATFARDTSRLGGVFAPGTIQPVDMFPQTAGIELAAVFEKR